MCSYFIFGIRTQRHQFFLKTYQGGSRPKSRPAIKLSVEAKAVHISTKMEMVNSAFIAEEKLENVQENMSKVPGSKFKEMIPAPALDYSTARKISQIAAAQAGKNAKPKVQSLLVGLNYV